MIYKAFLNRQEITGFPVNGKETTEIYGGNTLLWKKKKEVIEEYQLWGEYDLYARFKDPTPYKRAEVGFTTQGRDADHSYQLAFGFCTRVVNGIYMVTAAAVDDYVLTGQIHNDISMVPACWYGMTAKPEDQMFKFPWDLTGGSSKDDVLKEYRLYTKSESEPIYSWGGAFEEKPFWFKDSDKQAGVFDVSTPQVVSDEETGKYYYYPARLFSNVRDMKNWLLEMRNNPDKWWTDK